MNMKVGDKIEFCYLESIRVGRVVDIVAHYSAKENKVIATFVYVKDDDGEIATYALDEMEEIDILKKIYDSNGKELDPEDFVQFSLIDKKGTYLWGEITYGCNGDYVVETLYPKSKEGEEYPVEQCEIVLVSKHND